MPPGGVIQRDFLVGERVVAAAPASSQAGGQAAAHKPLGTAQLNGTVVGADGKPLEGAQVYLVGTAVGARADSRGIFHLSGLPSGTQTVEVRQLSYSPKRYTVDLSPSRESRLTAVMDAKAQVLGDRRRSRASRRATFRDSMRARSAGWARSSIATRSRSDSRC